MCYCCNLSGTFYICRVQFSFPAVVQSTAPCYKKTERYFEVMHAVLRYHIFPNSFLFYFYLIFNGIREMSIITSLSMTEVIG